MPTSGPNKCASDAWVNAEKPNQNNGATPALHCQYGKRRTLIHVPRPGPTELGTNKIISCQLRLRQRASGTWHPSGFTMRATLVSENWGGSNVTWNTKPALRQEAAATMTFTIPNLGSWGLHTIELAPIMEAAANNDWNYYGIALMANNNETYDAQFYSKESIGSEPQVYWYWGAEPHPPTGLSPNGTRSTVKPRFTASTANVPVSTLALQISQTPNFSGALVKDLRVNLGGATKIDYTPGNEFGNALASNSEYYYRMTYNTPEGLWSGWSSVTHFAIKTKPYVNITSIVSAITTDGEPQLEWDYTPGEGGNQTRAKVIVYIWVNNQWDRHYEAAIEGGDTGHQMPAGALIADRTYLQEIRVWDEEERDNDASDPDYATDSTQWVCHPNWATRGVDDLTGTIQPIPELSWHGNAPIIRLTWYRNEVPDRFILYRKLDNETPKEIIAQGVPDDYAPDYSAGNYEYLDAIPGGTDVRYFITAKVGKKESQATNKMPYMAGTPLTNAWDLVLQQSGDAVLNQLYDRYCWNQHFARIAIANGGEYNSSIRFRQILPLAVPNSIYRISLRARAPEGNRPAWVYLYREDSPWTVYGSAQVNLTSEWQYFEWDWNCTGEWRVVMALYCGTSTYDVDVDYFKSYLPGTSTILSGIETDGWWLVPELNWHYAVPFTRVVTDDTEYDESIGEHHVIGGKFVVVRAPYTAKKINLTGYMDRDSGLLTSLERIVNDNMVCRLCSSRGHYSRVVLGKGFKVSEVGELHGRKMHKVSITCLEVDV